MYSGNEDRALIAPPAGQLRRGGKAALARATVGTLPLAGHAFNDPIAPTMPALPDVELFLAAARQIARNTPDGLFELNLFPMDIPHLRQLSLAQVLDFAEHGKSLRQFLADARGRSSREELARTLIELGAPRELMVDLFRMSTRRFSSERSRLRIVGPRGRPITSLLDNATEQRIWRLWVAFAKPVEPRRLRRPEHWLLIARELPGNLRSAWGLIQRWARDRQSLDAFASELARLSPAWFETIEQDLMLRHGLDSPPPDPFTA